VPPVHVMMRRFRGIDLHPAYRIGDDGWFALPRRRVPHGCFLLETDTG